MDGDEMDGGLGGVMGGLLGVVARDVPFEFVGEVSGTGAMAEASHIKSGPCASRHD